MIPYDTPPLRADDAGRRFGDQMRGDQRDDLRQGQRDDVGALLRRIVDPPAYCPGCLAEAGLAFPERATTRHCARCLGRIRRVYRCARWNQDHAHQVAAGHANWGAFSARWRASSGLAPLSAEAARRYVTPEMIRGPLGMLLPERLRTEIHRAWCVGQLLGVEAWLAEEDAPPHPDGLWASAHTHGHDADPPDPNAVTQEAKEVADGRT